MAQPRQHRKPHPHPPHHSGATAWDFDHADPRPAKPPPAAPHYGTYEHTVQTCLAALRALRSNGERHKALGVVLARLVEREDIKGLKDCLKIALYAVHHYGPGPSYPPA